MILILEASISRGAEHVLLNKEQYKPIFFRQKHNSKSLLMFPINIIKI